jgi:hypothetical protein
MNETNTIMVCVQIGKKVISKAPFLVGPISPRKRAQMQAEEAAVDNHDLSVLTSKNGGIMGIHDEIRGI